MILKFYELKYSGGAVSYQKSSGLDIPSKWNQEGVEGHGQTILCCRGAGIGSFPPLTGYALLQTQAVRSTPVSICLLLFIDSTGKKKQQLTKAVTNANTHPECHSYERRCVGAQCGGLAHVAPLVQLSLVLPGSSQHTVQSDSWIVTSLALPISANLMSRLPSESSDNCKLGLQDIALNQSLKAEYTYQSEFQINEQKEYPCLC